MNVSLKQRLGRILFRHMPVSRHVFDHFRLELNALYVRASHRLNPFYRHRIRLLKDRRKLLVNLGCGPYGGPDGWVNLDLYAIEHVYLRTDCRRGLPLADGSCAGVHVEMFLEHLDPVDEVPVFLREVHRSLEPGGIARFIVPDAERFIRAYLEPGWAAMERISYEGEDWSRMFGGKMDALNHVFQQGYEHYGGWDYERLERLLREAGFRDVGRAGFATGRFPGGPIDRECHAPGALYVEASR